MKMLTWGLNLLIVLMNLKFRQGFVRVGWSGRILMVRHAPELFAGGEPVTRHKTSNRV